MLQPADDLTECAWINDRLASWLDSPGAVVGSVVPNGFEAYACIFHPAREQSNGDTRWLTWAEFAKRNGKTVHPEMQWNAIAGFPSMRDLPADLPTPFIGTLGSEECAVLASLLTAFTSSPDDYWYCIWTGYPAIARHDAIPVLRAEGRSYLVFRGPPEEVTQFPTIHPHYPVGTQPPNLWWPADRAWCVATDIDLPFTYVGGPSACIAHILKDSSYEALQTRLDARVDESGDHVNS